MSRQLAPSFRRAKAHGTEACFFYVYDPNPCEWINQQPISLYAIMLGKPIDRLEFSAALRRNAAREWVRRFPNGAPANDLKPWFAKADKLSNELLAKKQAVEQEVSQERPKQTQSFFAKLFGIVRAIIGVGI